MSFVERRRGNIRRIAIRAKSLKRLAVRDPAWTSPRALKVLTKALSTRKEYLRAFQGEVRFQ
jgi:hypothetical protein